MIRKFYTSLEMLDFIKEFAEKHGWEEICHQENIKMISYKREGVRINCYYSKMTIATAMLHPVKGATQLYRRNMWNPVKLEKIFVYPRVHTGRGYYKRMEIGLGPKKR